MIIYPTHTCFDDAIQFCEDRARKRGRGWLSLVVVHGIVLVPEDQPTDDESKPGERSVHAWVEDGDLVWDAGLLEGERIRYSVNHDEYYAFWRVQETTRYSMHDVLEQNLRSGTFGPWRPEYRALCRKRAMRTTAEP